MKSFILCFLLITLVVLNSEVQAQRNCIDHGVLDPCKRPGGPHPVCNGNTQPANPYDHVCPKIHRCRNGN
ncbi:protein RALF-like 25 [Pyrus ussuriensis x Pyrus communis]|uniref:Protein RALF-like 25 n=1 Tax=Pyrus ussuriensis x Pyrus communis TaxID=2448454 RepID=A0A5N5FLM2_9ROSA|nr:protein RALF-like 25 [Pyrus ussuriensis x Pyrus communis]